jgi:hypothetical protein
MDNIVANMKIYDKIEEVKEEVKKDINSPMQLNK